MLIARCIAIAMLFGLPTVMMQHALGQDMTYAEQLTRLIRWLPDETESLIVTRGSKCDFDGREDFDPVFPCGSEGALSVIRAHRFQKRLKDMRIIMAVHASCRFSAPNVDRAQVKYAGCQLVLFEQEITASADKLLGDMAADADGSFRIGGRHVVRFKEEWHRQDWTFLVCFPLPKVLVVATDEQYLRELIGRMDQPTSVNFLHDERLETEVTRSADAHVLAVRRYKEPSLELEIPRGARGFVFRYVDPKTAGITFLTAQSTKANAVRDIWRLFPPISTNPDVMAIEDGVFEVRHAISEQENWDGFWLLLMWRLGHQFG